MKIHVNLSCAPPLRLFKTLQGLPDYSYLSLKDVEEVLSECEICPLVQNHVRPRKASPGITLGREATCNDILYMDHKLMLTKARKNRISSSNRDPNYNPNNDKSSILTFLEPVSGATWALPVVDYESESVKSAIRVVFMIHGPVKTIVADNAPSFTALKSWLFDEWGVNLCATSAYHPNSNLSERPHAEFEKVMSVHDSKSGQYNFQDWEQKLAKSVVS